MCDGSGVEEMNVDMDTKNNALNKRLTQVQTSSPSQGKLKRRASRIVTLPQYARLSPFCHSRSLDG